MIGRLQLHYVMCESKLDSSLLSAQFHRGIYEIRNRRIEMKVGVHLLSWLQRNHN